MQHFDTLILGSGVSARGVLDGIKSTNTSERIKILAPERFSFSYSQPQTKNGMSRYWHLGMMLPSKQAAWDLGIDFAEMQRFCLDNEILVKNELDIHILDEKVRDKYQINHDNVLSFKSIKIYFGTSNKNHKVIINDNITLTSKNIYFCLSTFGNYATLINSSMGSQISDDLYFNDHIMSTLDFDDSSSLDRDEISGRWFQKKNILSQYRKSYSKRKVNFSKHVWLLTVPFIGKVFYGILSPSLLVNMILKKFKADFNYLFKLETPEISVHQMVVENSKYTIKSRKLDPGECYAFHPIGPGDPDLISRLARMNVYLCSGNMLPNNFYYFPTLTVFFLSFKLGYNVSSTEM